MMDEPYVPEHRIKIKPQRIYNNICTYSKELVSKGRQHELTCSALTGVNRFFCLKHIKVVDDYGI